MEIHLDGIDCRYIQIHLFSSKKHDDKKSVSSGGTVTPSPRPVVLYDVNNDKEPDYFGKEISMLCENEWGNIYEILRNLK